MCVQLEAVIGKKKCEQFGDEVMKAIHEFHKNGPNFQIMDSFPGEWRSVKKDSSIDEDSSFLGGKEKISKAGELRKKPKL